MSVFAAAVVRGVILLALVAIGLTCWRSSSAAMRHMAWVMATVGLLVLPIMSLVLPGWTVLPSRLDIAAAVNSATEDERPENTPVEYLPTVDSLPPVRVESVEPLPTRTELVEPIPEDGLPSTTLEIDATVLPTESPGSDDLAEAPAAGPQVPEVRKPTVQVNAGPQKRAAAWLLGVWSVGATVLLLRLLASQFGLWRLTCRSSRVTDGNLLESVNRIASSLSVHRSVRVYLSRDRHIPMTWGLIAPRLLLPADAGGWDGERLRAVLAHELAHVKRWDCQTQLLAQIACALHWLNPLAWLAVWRIGLERERACDDMALASGIVAADYAEHLIGITSGLSQRELASYTALAMARPSRLAARLSLLLDERLNRRNVTTGVMLTTVVSLTALILPISMMRAAASPDEAVVLVEEDSSSEQDDETEQFARDVADRVVKALEDSNLSFVAPDRLPKIHADFRAFVATLDLENVSAGRRAEILKSIEDNGTRMFKPSEVASEKALNRTFLAFPDALRTLKWKLYRATKCGPLSDEEATRLDEQRQWMRTIINGLADEGDYARDRVLKELETRFNDPLCIGLARPMTNEQFQKFQARISGEELSVRYVMDRLLVSATSQLNLFRRDTDLPFDDRVISYGAGTGLVHLGFASNERFCRWSRSIADVESSNSVVDATTGLRHPAPDDVENKEEFRRWLDVSGKGDFAYDQTGGGKLVAVRGAKLLALNVENWLQADGINDKQLRERLNRSGGNVVPLADFRKRLQQDEDAQTVYAGILTKEGRLAVVQVQWFRAPNSIDYLVRCRTTHESPTDQSVAVRGLENGAWSEPIEGLQFRLSAARTEFQSWELPTFVMEVQNRGYKAVTEKRAQSLFGDGRHGPGLRFLFEDQYKRAFNPNVKMAPRIHLDVQKLVGLEIGDSMKQTLTLTAIGDLVFQQSAPVDLKPGRYTIGIGKIGPRLAADLKTHAVTLNILPPGVKNNAELAAFLRPYRINNQSLKAGFVPNKTTLVWGEPTFVTFTVQNLDEETFTFEFGGDYRGSGRHERFKIKVTHSDGNLLPDPSRGFHGGGLLTPRVVQGRDVVVETVELADFRSLPGPGEYTVSCRFDLMQHWVMRGEPEFRVPVETTYKLTILPREPANVRRVLAELFDQSYRTSGTPLWKLIDTICSFGKEAAVPGLVKMATDGDATHRIAAIRGLGKVTTSHSLDTLLQADQEEQIAVRVAAITALGAFTDPPAVEAAVKALSDPNDLICTTAATALGSMKTDAAIDALIARLPDARPPVGAAVLRAMGATQSSRVFDIIVRSLANDGDAIRRAAVDAVTNFPAEQAANALKPYTTDSDMDFREEVIRKLAESLKQPIEPQWLVPVIKSRNGARSIGDAPRLLRLYTGDKAAPAILGCLDFENPAVRNYYNLTVMNQQLACDGLAVPWNADLNRDGTPDEIAQNRRTLRCIKHWVDHYQANPTAEPPLPWRLDREEEEKTWGDPVDDLSIRARVYRSVWPAGLPQVLTIDARGHPGQGSVNFSERPDPLEVEVNGTWYHCDPNTSMKVTGSWNAYHGNPSQDIQLDNRWRRKSDGQPLDLTPGNYIVRIRLSITPKDKQTGLAMSKPVKFEVIPTPSPRAEDE